MEAKELRIDNLLVDSLTGAYLRVYKLDEDDIYTEVIDRTKYPLPQGWQAVPIPLTPELLVKCGFIDENNGIWAKEYRLFAYTNEILVIPDVDGCQVSITSRVDDTKLADLPLCYINYVHQLQNLYFALTGSELIINLENEHI